MADKHSAGCECVPEISKLRAELAALVSGRLEAVKRESKDDEVLKVLGRRRKKWMRRHKLVSQQQEYCPVDPALGEEKETLTFHLAELKLALARRRKEGLTHARQRQGGKHTHCLNIIREWQQRSRQSFQDYRESRYSNEDRMEVKPSITESAEEKLVQDLRDTLSQVEALRGIRDMKHHATPRLPQLHNPNNYSVEELRINVITDGDTPELPDILLNTEECDVVYTVSGHDESDEIQAEKSEDSSTECWLQMAGKNPPDKVGTEQPKT